MARQLEKEMIEAREEERRWLQDKLQKQAEEEEERMRREQVW